MSSLSRLWSKLPTISEKMYRRLALWNLIGLGLLIVSGGAVRLTASGLGCPQWPSCGQSNFVGELSTHKEIEFGNRILSTVVSIFIALTVIAAFRLAPKRDDLKRGALAVLAGILLQIIMGGLVVKYHLWPPLVMLHFLLSELLVGVGMYLHWRIDNPLGFSNPMVGRKFIVLVRGLIISTGILMLLGTATSGAGPHGGSRGSKRLPVSFRGISEAHATFAAYLIGLIVATLFACWIGNVALPVIKRAKLLLGMALLQAAIGYSQYFLKDPASIVIFHLAGATLLLIFVLNLYFGLFSNRNPQDQDLSRY